MEPKRMDAPNEFFTSSFGGLGAPPSGIILHDSEFYDKFFAGGVEAKSCNINGVLMHSSGKEVDRREIDREWKGIPNSLCSSANPIVVAPSNVVKRQWTTEEDSLLIELVNHHGVSNWPRIAKKIVGKIGKQCRDRWHNHLRPDIKKDKWSEEEELLLVDAHKKIGNRWSEIARQIPGRTENSIKNHWNATKRRQESMQKCKRKSKKSKPYILQAYIKSMTSNHDDTRTRKSTIPSMAMSSPPNQFHMMPPLLLPEPMLDYDFSSGAISSYNDERTLFVHSSMDEESLNVVDNIQDPPLVDQLDFTEFNYDDGYKCNRYLHSLPTSDYLLYKEATARATPPPPAADVTNATTTTTIGVVGTCNNRSSSSNHMVSDICLTHLFDGYPWPFIDGLESSDVKVEVHQVVGDEAASGDKRDMDLIEMVLSFFNKSDGSCNISKSWWT